MSVIKLTKKDIIKKDDEDKKIKLNRNQISYDSALVSGWETDADESFGTLQKYREKLDKGDYLSPDDLNSYKSAMDRYIENSNRLRGLNKTLGKGFTEEEEKQWNDNISSMQSGYTEISDYFSKYKTEDEYKKAEKAQKDYEAMTTFDLEAGKAEIEDLLNGDEITILKKRQAAIQEQIRELGASGNKGKGASKRLQLQKELNEVNATIKGIESQASQKKAYLNQAKHIQDGLKLTNDALNAEDFAEKSQYVSTKAEGFLDKLTSDALGYNDTTYEYINNVDGYRDAYKEKHSTYSKDNIFDDGESSYEEKGYDYLTNDEIAVYNYYYATEGKEKAEEFLNNIQETLNARKASTDFREIEGHTFEEIVFGVEAGLDQFKSGMKNLFNTNDDYIPSSATQMTSGMVREDLADDGFKILGNSIGQIGYDLVNTTSNMLPSILTSAALSYINPALGSAVGTGLMGASASGNAYAEMINLGYDKGQARLYSGLVGASEATLQYLLGGIGKLGGKLSGKAAVSIANNFDNALARVAIKLGGNALGEFTEEYLQEVLNPFFKNLTLGTNEDIKLFSSEALYSGILGALSAGILEGGSTIYADRQTTKLGQSIQKVDGGVERLKKLGTTFAADTVAYQIANKINENTGAYKIGLLLQEAGATLSEQNVSDIVAGLTKKGMTERDAKKLAKTYQAFLNNEMSLSDEEVAVLEGLDPLADVLRKNIIGRDTEIYQRTREYDELYKLATEVAESKSNPSTAPQAEASQNFAPYSQEYVDSVVKEFESMGIPSKQARIVAEKKLSSSTETNSTPTTENAVESKFAVSESNETINTKTGEAVKVVGIESIKNGEMVLKVENSEGNTETISANDVSFSSNDALIYSAVADMGASETAAWNIVKNFKPSDGVSANVYAQDVAFAYKYGVLNYKQGLSNLDLTADQALVAFYQGRNDAEAKLKRKVNNPTKATAKNKTASNGKVIFEGFKYDESTANDLQKSSMAGINLIAEISPLEVHVYKSFRENGKLMAYVNGKKRLAPNGYFIEGTNKIYIDINAGAKGEGLMLDTAGHEITHYIAEWNWEGFKELGDFLFEYYGADVPVDTLINTQKQRIIESYKRDGKPIPSEDELFRKAYEETVADAMSKMLADERAYTKLAELKQQNQTLWEKIGEAIKNLLDKIKSLIGVYSQQGATFKEAEYVEQFSKDVYEKLQDLYLKAFVEANAKVELLADAKPISADEIITDGATVTDSDGKVYSIRSMKSDITDGQMFRDLMTHCGFTKEQVGTLRTQLEDLVEYMIPFRDIVDMNETYGREGRRFAPYKPNSDPLYTISLDFSTLCSKRLLTQYVIEQLQLREKRPMSAEEQMAIRDMLKEYAKIEKGLQVACVMCYVEAARLKSPKQIQKWLDDPATVMRNYFADQNPEFAAYIKKAQADFKESRGYARDASKSEMKEANKQNGAKDIRALNQLRPRLRAEYKPSAEEMKIIETAVALPKETFLTAGNLANLSEEHSEIYKAYTAFIRTATRSKSLETDEPYYYGDSTRDNGNRIVVSDSFIEAINKENGMRFSSWSDWRIQHLLDWITAVIDNSVRGAAMHGYTKYGDEVRVLGNTGMMFNMSGVPGTQTGLNEDGSLNFSDTESMDYKEAIALRKEFPETAGLQCIGVSKEHIFALLRSDVIDYVIPYHTSGLNATLRRMGDIYGWENFTNTQHATENKSIKKENAVDPDHWHQEPVFSEFFVGYNTGLGGVEAMQKSAENYIRMCEERGLTPKFVEFSKEPNYWKLLIDRKMVNTETNTLIEQKAVTPKFDFDVIKGIVDKYVKNYDAGLEERAFNHIVENWDNIPKRIRDLKKQGTTKAKSTKKSIDKLANEPVAAQPKDNLILSDRVSIINAEETKTPNEQTVSDFVSHMRGLIKDKGGWYDKDVFKYIEAHPELDFIERIYQKDKSVKKDLEAFLAKTYDEKVLDGLSWFIGEAYGDKGHTWTWEEGSKYPYRGAVRTFRNAVKKRINEIESEKVGGTNLGVKNGEISLEDTKKLFNELNTNKEIGELAEKVFNTAEMLGVNIRFANQTFAKGNVAGDAMGDMVEYKTSYFNDTAYSNQHKAKTILHELIHTCTVYVMHEDSKYNLMVNYHSINGKSDNYVKLRNASTRLNRIFAEIKNDPDFKGQYGLKNSQEMVAELANEEFVALLKKKTLWDRIIDAIAELFGFSRGNSAYDNVVQCLDYILDNPDIKEYKAYAIEQRKNARYDGRGVFGSTNYTDYYENVMYSERVSNKELASMDETALYIKNTKNANYIGMIFNGTKTEETRSRRTLDAFIGKDFYVTDGKYVYGSVVFGEPHKYTEEEFHKLENRKKHRVPKGDEYDIKPGGIKWAYPIESYKKFDKPKKLSDSKEYKNSFQAREVMYSDRDAEAKKPRSAQAQRDAGYMLSEAKFYQLYSAHKLTYGNRGGEIKSIIDKIKKDGFISSTSIANVLPTSTMSHFDYDDNGKVKFANIVQFRYAPKKGDYVLFVPNNYITKDDIIKNGFKPLDYEIAIVEYDYQPYYELYTKAYNSNKTKFSDRDYIETDSKAVMTTERIDYLIEDSGAGSRVDYANYWITSISPTDFLNMTLPSGLQDRSAFDKYPSEWNDESTVDTYDYIGELKRNMRQTPYLAIDINTGKVDGHEGRHRMRALEKQGITSVEIRVEFRDEDGRVVKYSPDGKRLQIKDALTIGNQYGTKQSATLNKVIPLNKDYREEIFANYGENAQPNADTKYSERDLSTSNRAILANALEGAAQNDIEKNKLAEYKKKISLIESEEQRLSEIQKQLFTKGAAEPSQRKDLQFEAKQIANRINTYDRQLLNLESTTALKNVLNREKALAMKRQKQKDTEYLKQYKEKVAKTQRELLERNQESRKKAIEGREKTAMRHKIKSVVNDLNNLLLKPTKERHVPEEMRIAVAEALTVVNMDTVSAEERVAKYNALIAKATDPDIIASLTATRDRILEQGDKMSDKLTKLKDAYGMVRDSTDDSVRSMYDDVIYSKIESVQRTVGKTPLRNMTLSQLESVYDLYRMVLTTIRDSNKAFAENLNMTRLALGSNTFAEIKETNKVRDTIKHPSLEKFIWQNLKPMQAMKTIGSETLQKLWNNILYGQEVFAVDYDEAVKFAKEMKEKHGYEKWNKDKLYSFASKSGKTMKLNLEQMMSIYAYSKRAQADEHIEYGGIVLNEGVIKVKNKLGKTVEVKVNDSTAYRLDKLQVAGIISALEKEFPGAKAFVDDMQKYLSETMGEKGNEVSMKMYGIKLFKEEHYFPLKSSKDFMEAANAKLKGDVKIKNKGMTKSTVEHARNPIVLENFLDVWGNHINEMAMYHGLVLPLEDFSRTLNYSFKADDSLNTDAESVRTALHDAFGESADNYLNELLKAINGGVLHDSSAEIADKMISKFKKAKVMASLSVIVQQPTAIIRAMGIIDPKYFVAQNFNHKATWEELKKYCPTAIIKETGSFDTNMGRTIVDMIKDERGFTDKVGDALGKAPAYMDEVGWNMIWRALKKKVAAEQKLSGEALLEECGKQMTLIINETQVYDSVMSRNELMRSKNALTKMATAFMAEPSTVANMVYGAALDFKRGKKGIAGKTVTAVITSVVINGLVSPLVYALRDDDEEKTWLEKYLSSATTEVVDGLNPLTYIPFVKDAYSLFQGYKVERTDMALIKDVVDAVDSFYKVLDPEAYEGMSREEIAKHIYENSVPLLTSICDMFGLPVGNVLRDAEAIIINDNIPMSQTSSSGIGYAFKEGLQGALPKIVEKVIGTDSKQDKLYDAIVSGDTAYIERLKSGYKDDKAYETAVRKALRENDPRIKEAAELRKNGEVTECFAIVDKIANEGHFKRTLVISAVNSELEKLKKAEK